MSATIRTGGSGSSWILLRLGAGEICSEPMRKEVPPPISYPFSERHLEAVQGPNTLIPGHRFESPAASCTPGCFFSLCCHPHPFKACAFHCLWDPGSRGACLSDKGTEALEVKYKIIQHVQRGRLKDPGQTKQLLQDPKIFLHN